MKRTAVILSILALAALVSFAWIKVERIVLENNYPLEFKEYVDKYSEKYSVPENIVYGIIKTESNFKRHAYRVPRPEP